MKNALLSIGSLLALTLIATPSPAAEKVKAKAVTPAPTAAPAHRTYAAESTSHSNTRVGFGFATYGGTGAGIGMAHALSFWIDLNQQLSVQPFLGVTSSSPFNFGVGATLRYTIRGNHTEGFHLGGGVNLGTLGGTAVGGGSTFFLNIFPVAGFHFSLGNALSNLQLSFDGGPVLAITPTFQFQVAPLGIIGGASIHYFF